MKSIKAEVGQLTLWIVLKVTPAWSSYNVVVTLRVYQYAEVEMVYVAVYSFKKWRRHTDVGIQGGS